MEMNDKAIFWNNRFLDKKTLFGTAPADITIKCEKVLNETDIDDILVVGAGYGRNGQYFIQKGYRVDGIEIAEEAIAIGRQLVPEMNFIQGDVLHMKLDKKYGAVFCYDMLQLFVRHERETIVANCIEHCRENGRIILSCLSTEDMLFGNGTEIEKNTFEIRDGLTIHCADTEEMRHLHQNLTALTVHHCREKEGDGTARERSRLYGIYAVNGPAMKR